MLLLDVAKQQIEEFLCKDVSSTNCVEMMNLANLYRLEKLHDVFMTYLQTRLTLIKEQDNFSVLKEDVVKEILQNEAIDDELKFLALQKWTESDGDGNSKFSELVAHIDFASMSKDFLKSVVTMDGRMREEGCLRHLQEAKLLHIRMQKEGFLVTGTEGGDLWSLYGNRCRAILGLPEKYEESCACGVPGGLVVTGGHRNRTATKDAYHLDWETGTWRALLDARCRHKAAYHDGFLYVAEGNTFQRGRLSTIKKIIDYAYPTANIASIGVT
jgi:hypothetical protein